MKKKNNGLCLYIIIGVLLVLSYTIYVVCAWSRATFGVGIDEIIFTITSPLKGSDTSVVQDAVKECLPKIAVVIISYIAIAVVCSRNKIRIKLHFDLKKRAVLLDLTKTLRVLAVFASVLSLVASLMYVETEYNIIQYIDNKLHSTKVYENYYVPPTEANIKLKDKNGNYKNLIYIYLESMETTYTSVENGGSQQICYIPNLVEMARNNISFSDNNGIGGFISVYGANYTMGALMATTAGVPFSFPTDGNSMNNRETFASGLTTLGDVLEGFGYNQMFLCGSDADFAGRRTYFTQHGNYEIYDLYTAREEDYIDDDYFVWWGYEDMYLYEIAKNELTELANKNEPFNFTMLTVDTHHISGYKCQLCTDEYEQQAANVISCADRQIGAFIDWCKDQSFYDNTVIVVSGDHPRMDTDLVEGVKHTDRTIYNCFINCDNSENAVTVNRTFTPMDMFPTVLSSLGFSWDGDRLGLGTNMFSTKQTLAEELGFENLNSELSRSSSYYLKHFS